MGARRLTLCLLTPSPSALVEGGPAVWRRGTTDTEWLRECFFRHRDNAEVVRQDLLRERSIDASLRTVERAVAPHRRLLGASVLIERLFAPANGQGDVRLAQPFTMAKSLSLPRIASLKCT